MKKFMVIGVLSGILLLSYAVFSLKHAEKSVYMLLRNTAEGIQESIRKGNTVTAAGKKEIMLTFKRELSSLSNVSVKERAVFLDSLQESNRKKNNEMKKIFLLLQQILEKRRFPDKNSLFRYSVKSDSSAVNTEALIFYHASLFYMNPGDESTFPEIKKNLVPLLNGKALTRNEKRTVLSVLLGISREEEDTASVEKYEAALKAMGAEK